MERAWVQLGGRSQVLTADRGRTWSDRGQGCRRTMRVEVYNTRQRPEDRTHPMAQPKEPFWSWRAKCVLLRAFESRYKKPLETEGNVFPWLVRHAGWLISRFLVKQDGRSPYERLRGRDFRGEVVECCEVVHYKLDRDKTCKLDNQS